MRAKKYAMATSDSNPDNPTIYQAMVCKVNRVRGLEAVSTNHQAYAVSSRQAGYAHHS